jgi:hypothetical protein
MVMLGPQVAVLATVDAAAPGTARPAASKTTTAPTENFIVTPVRWQTPSTIRPDIT